LFRVYSHLQCRPKAGENFIAWAKENRKAIPSNCSFFFSSLKTIVNKGGSSMLRDDFSGWHCHC
jgi:hypothetical protein